MKWYMMLVSALVTGAIGAGTILQQDLQNGPLTREKVIIACITGTVLLLNQINAHLSKPPTAGGKKGGEA